MSARARARPTHAETGPLSRPPRALLRDRSQRRVRNLVEGTPKPRSGYRIQDEVSCLRAASSFLRVRIPLPERCLGRHAAGRPGRRSRRRADRRAHATDRPSGPDSRRPPPPSLADRPRIEPPTRRLAIAAAAEQRGCRPGRRSPPHGLGRGDSARRRSVSPVRRARPTDLPRSPRRKRAVRVATDPSRTRAVWKTSRITFEQFHNTKLGITKNACMSPITAP